MNEMNERMKDSASETDRERKRRRESEKRSLKRKEIGIERERDYIIDAGVIVLSLQHSN